jgi:Protein of unknown function (DUF3089)
VTSAAHRFVWWSSSLVVILALLVPTPVDASAASKPTAPPASGGTVWLCRPGLADDPCTGNLTATAVQANGHTSVVRARAAARPPVDCFYVYPTVSAQPGPNADLEIDPEERAVAVTQAARFSQVCRVYAPMYKQITRAAIAGGTISASAAVTAYTSVLSAWNDYLAHDNHGRGIVLIGHSQGASLLIGLMKREIDPNPALRKRLVSAIVVGGNVTVPQGKTLGGDFAHIPACVRPAQTGCVVAYSSFDATPPADSFFGRVGTSISVRAGFGASTNPDLEVLCTNPAALAGGSGVLQTYFPRVGVNRLNGQSAKSSRTKSITTPWVTYPDLYRARCQNVDGSNVLMVSVKDNAPDPRPVVSDVLGPRWGLHLDDVNLAMGNLVSLVRRESAAWSSEAGARRERA